MTREQMIEELSKISVRAIPTVQTMDMGLQYDFVTSEGAGSSFGNMGEWPLYKFKMFDDEKWKIIREQIENQTLSEDQFIDTGFYPIVRMLHNIYGEEYDNFYGNTLEAFSGLKHLDEKLTSDLFCMFDARAWGERPQFFQNIEDLTEAFREEYCYDIVLWEEMDDEDVEFWYERLSEDLATLMIADYSSEVNDDE